MRFWLSEGIETLTAEIARKPAKVDGLAADEFDVLIVGSGYGGAVAAARIAGRLQGDGERRGLPLKVAVLERGLEYLPGEFPESIADITASVRIDRGGDQQPLGPSDALFRIYANGDALTVVGSALGGGSQINASVCERVEADVFATRPWPAEIQRDAAEMPRRFARYYRLVESALGVQVSGRGRQPGYPKQAAFESLAKDVGREHGIEVNVRPVKIAVHKPDGAGAMYDDFVDPRYDLPRKACIGCGNCVTGCNHHAKNTLTTNYLALAKRRGAKLYTGANVATVKRLPQPKGGTPEWIKWEVSVWPTAADKRPELRRPRDHLILRAGVVILAAGTLGSTEILLRSSERPRVKTADDAGITPAPLRRESIDESPRASYDEEIEDAGITSEFPRVDQEVVASLASREVAPADAGTTDEGAPGYGDDESFRPEREAQAKDPKGQRHANRLPLVLSPALGTRFSGNGDALSFRYFEDQLVDSVAGLAGAAVPPGPTITDMMDLRPRKRPQFGPGFADRIVVQNGVIPRALVEVFGELVTTTGLLNQLDRFKTRHEVKAKDIDPLAVSVDALRKTQVLLCMGHDPAAGRLELVELQGDLGWWPTRPARVRWPSNGLDPVFQQQEQLLDVPCRPGVTISNPVATPVPRSISEVLSTPVASGRMTVHPLGGCPMADRADAGVVNHAGHVYAYRAGSSDVYFYEGLYVLDGSILPTSVGINPSLTIAAIAERAVAYMRGRYHWGCRPGSRIHLPALPVLPRLPKRPQPPALWPPVSMHLRERLRLDARRSAIPPRWLRIFGSQQPFLNRNEDAGVALDLDYHVDDMYAFLTDHASVPDSRRLEVNPQTSLLRFLQQPATLVIGQREEDLVEPIPISRGVLTFLRVEPDRLVCRVIRALREWLAIRGRIEILRGIKGMFTTLGRLLRRQCRIVRRLFARMLGHSDSARHAACDAPGGLLRPNSESLSARLARIGKLVTGIFKLAYHAGEIRTFGYEIEFTGRDNIKYVLRGQKRVTLNRAINPWRSLADLNVQLFEHYTDAEYEVRDDTFSLDLVDLLRERVPQVTQRPDTVSGMFAAIAFGAFMARVMLHTYMWRFQAPDYPDDDAIPPRRRAAGPLSGCRGPWYHTVPVPISLDKGKPRPRLPLLLTRYAPEDATRAQRLYPVILFPGFAASSLQFSTDGVRHDDAPSRNLVQALCDAGFDVWLADVRTSSALPSGEEQSDFDQVAAVDVPEIVKYVLDKTSKGKVHLIGHCMGGANIAMAATRQGSLLPHRNIQSYIFSQVSPFVVASRANALRAEFAGILRSTLGDTVLHPTVDRVPTAFDVVFDRFAWSYPVAADCAYELTLDPRPEVATIKRLQAMLGVMWLRQNVSTAMERNFQHTYGPGNVRTFWQIMHIARKGRAVDFRARNTYSADDGLAQAFNNVRALFVHGEQSQMFDPRGSSSVCDHLNKLIACPPGMERFEYLPLSQYGHFDTIIGKNAHKGVYPRFIEFLEKAETQPLPEVGEQRYGWHLRVPACGPILGWTRATNGAFRARVWVEIDSGLTAQPLGAIFLVWDSPLPDAGANGGGEASSIAQWFVGSGVDRPPVRHAWFADFIGREFSGMAAVAIADIDVPDPMRPCHVLCLAVYQTADGSEPVDTPLTERLPEEDAGGGSAPPEPADWVGRVKYVPLTTVEDDNPVNQKTYSVKGKDLNDFLDVLIVQKAPLHYSKEELAIAVIPPSAAYRVSDSRKLTFLLGSCFSPGSPFDVDYADRSFASVLQSVEEAKPAFALFVGDQIYADDNADLFDVSTPDERFYERYRRAFCSTSVRKLLRRLPVYMAPDDHEIYDNFNGRSFEVVSGSNTPMQGGTKYADIRERIRSAETAYVAYQQAHGPKFDSKLPDGAKQPHWYTFRCGGFPFFVMDTRMERDWWEDRFISDEQWEALKAFLTAPGSPKFVASGSVILPMLSQTALGPEESAVREDSWWRYPEAVERVFDLIRSNAIDDVVFLAGDVHCSLFAKIKLVARNGNPLRAWSIVSSGLHAPYRFANTRPDDYVLDSQCLPRDSWVKDVLGHASWEVGDEKYARDSHAVVRVAEHAPDGADLISVEFVSSQRTSGDANETEVASAGSLSPS